MKIALTGHRPERLGLPIDETSPEWKPIREWLRIALVTGFNTGRYDDYKAPRYIVGKPITDVYCGMANGSDILIGLVTACCKNIKLHCVLPCKDYNNSNPNVKLLNEYADEWVELAEEFYKGCDNVRDQYMIDHCDVLIAIWDGNKSGGVWSTIRKAQKAGKDIIYCPQEILEKKLMKIKLKNNSEIITLPSDSESVRGHRSKIPVLLSDYNNLSDEEQAEIDNVIKSFIKEDFNNEENFKREYECIWLSSAYKEDK